MEIVLFLAVIVVAIGVFVYYNRSSKGLDVNKDGKVDSADVKAAVQNVVCGVQETADVNKDGKVDSTDAKAVVETAKAGAKKAATKTKAATKKVADKAKAGRKPRNKVK